MMKQIIMIFFGLYGSLAAFSQTTALDSLWQDPATEQRIQQGIETNRKGDFVVKFPAYSGKARIEVKQLRNAFFFGANAFMIGGFDNPQTNDMFERTFASLFNLAVVPFYWKALEPERGKPRYDANSPAIYRRPPPDRVLAFCRKYGVTPKGHNLVWNNPTWQIPDWLSRDTNEIEASIRGRIQSIGKRFGDSIRIWDVVNESLHYFPQVIMPRDYAYKAFVEAKKDFPASDELMINDVTSVWQTNNQEFSPYYLLIQNLLLRGAKINAIGLQFHLFNTQLFHNVLAGKMMKPKQLFDILDLYGSFKLPLQVSEITIPTLPNNDEGRQLQARLTRNFYRLWFSHPAVEAIVWWNPADGTAAGSEDQWNGGFLNHDLSPKPSYDVLNELINKEWKTQVNATVDHADRFSFRGFYGEYLITITEGKKVFQKKVMFTRDGQSVASIQQ